MVQISVCDKFVLENLQKRGKGGNYINLYVNFQLKDGLGVEFIGELMPDVALTSRVLFGAYRIIVPHTK